ncbi:MAG: DnaD domain protein [Saccharofermentans sp.]|nr:DnaD domain protein [Saccharofermentans sp.]
MKDNSSISELLLSDTSISDIFIVKHMASLSKDALCLYMWLNMTCGKNLKVQESDVESYGLLSKTESGKVIAELISHGLIIKDADDNYLLEDLKKVEVDSYIKRRFGEEASSTYQAFNTENKERDVLAASISKTFFQGHMHYIYFRLVDTCLYEYKFESSVVYRLFQEGRELKIHLKTDEMIKLAENWYKRGYTTPDALQVYFDKKKRTTEIISLMGKLTRKRLNELDYERIDTWVNELNATPKMVEYAFRVNEYRDHIKFIHVETKLKEWFAAGVTTLDAAMVYEAERKAENKAKASRKRGTDNVWRTGREAGITIEDAKKPEKEENKKEPDDDDDYDPILGMFGGDDEDN